MAFYLNRTTATDEHFQLLVRQLDHELWVELEEDQATYDRYNKVPDIKTALVAYEGDEPVACGCFKAFNDTTVEIKRMFVRKDKRGKGLSKKILAELEAWAKEHEFEFAVLETSMHFNTARQLYSSQGYQLIPNYGPYANLPESVCMKKALK